MTPLLAAGAFNVIVTQFLAFGLLAFFIIKFGFPVMRKALAARKQEVADTFERLDRESREAAQRIAEFKERLAGIEAESKKRMQAALDEGAKAKAQSLAEANAQAAAEVEKARRAIGIERDKAVMQLRTEVSRLTLEATEKTIDGLMNEKLHGRIVDAYLEGIEKAARGR
jgi:F-type H+-transporting ATPase subunit b